MLDALVICCCRRMSYSLRSGKKRSIASAIANKATLSLELDQVSAKRKEKVSCSSKSKTNKNTNTSSSTTTSTSTSSADNIKTEATVHNQYFVDGTKGLDIGCLDAHELLGEPNSDLPSKLLVSSQFMAPAHKIKSTEGIYKEELYADVKTVKIEPYIPEDFPEVNIPVGNSRRNKKVRHIKIEYDDKALAALPKVKEDVWRPPFWKEQLLNIRQMRSSKDAPVDSMGCEKISDRDATPKEYRYQVLLSLMLSSMTKDEVTSAAMSKLRQHGCSIENILATSDDLLGRLIYPVGFWKTKVKNIKKTTQILKEQYSGDIPKTVTELMKLPGIGPKMSHLIMECGWNELTGIAVDTHVYRISQRLGWVQTTPKKPADCQKLLESWLPRELWREVNWLLVGFGQQMCYAVHPQCDACLNNTMCNFPTKKLANKSSTCR